MTKEPVKYSETDLKIKEFLLGLAKEQYSHGDSFYAIKQRGGNWVFGSSNDEPLKFGNGYHNQIQSNLAIILYNKLKPIDKSDKEELKRIANMVMNIDHCGVQVDDIHKCEEKHQAILALDKLDKHEAIRLMMHVIHVQQLQLVGANIEIDHNNPFLDMVNFDHIKNYVNSNSPDKESLYL